MVAHPDRGAGNDPEPFFFFFFFGGGGGGGWGSLSQPRLNIFTVGNMRVMICLGQGGLRSLSASSLYNIFFYLFNIAWRTEQCLHQFLMMVNAGGTRPVSIHM